jgi:hypothetical protein
VLLLLGHLLLVLLLLGYLLLELLLLTFVHVQNNTENDGFELM